MNSFQSIFLQENAQPARAKYLSRVFGIFSEEIVRIWASDPRAPFEDLGRPTVTNISNGSGYTLDFTLVHKESGRNFIAEMKCEIEYQKFKYLVLTNEKQLEHHKKPAFSIFLDAANNPSAHRVKIGGREIISHGSILIWGAATEQGRAEVIKAKGFFDILTVEEIVEDLIAWQSPSYLQLIEDRRNWTNELFDGLNQK